MDLLLRKALLFPTDPWARPEGGTIILNEGRMPGLPVPISGPASRPAAAAVAPGKAAQDWRNERSREPGPPAEGRAGTALAAAARACERSSLLENSFRSVSFCSFDITLVSTAQSKSCVISVATCPPVASVFASM
eukprot:CAMPEP_0194667380 /NCGR_PEP_ID=MMETSP0295-20121207/3293_1 /TAXON_ID=39354 /ORGANISM="Heterosigma akashiwo, Strain CCMP2393" /LENGTH=134 /DNA_ID=CAMNT_0039549843 /DNA_START=183 /DNA_END=587 /DNA_ORIENTATION=+